MFHITIIIWCCQYYGIWPFWYAFNGISLLFQLAFSWIHIYDVEYIFLCLLPSLYFLWWVISSGFCPFLNWVTWFLVILYISYFFVYFWITVHFQICHLKIFSSGFEDFFFFIVFPKFEYSMPRYIEFFTFIMNGDLWTSWTCSFGSDIISHCQQKSLKCKAWVQSRKWQNALCFQGNSFNIHYSSLCPNH